MTAQGVTGGDPGKVSVSGDTMTGPLILEDDSPAASEAYVGSHGGGGGGAVDSVNDQTGVVVLVASDVGAAADDDVRLSDARTPTAHATTHATGGSDVLTPAAIGAATPASVTSAISALSLGSASTHAASDFDSAGSATTAQSTAEAFATSSITALSLKTASTHDVPASGNATSGQVVLGADTRLTDSRTPSAHASTHASGGTDPVSPASIGALAASSNLADLSNAATGRTSLGLGTAATQSSSAFDAAGQAATAQTAAIAAAEAYADTGDALKLSKSSNLADLPSPSTARTSLGLGTAATQSSTAFDAAGAATTAQTAAQAYADAKPFGASRPIVGRYIYTGEGGATSSVTPTLNEARYQPFAVDTGFTCDKISVDVTTNVATAVVRIGLYADSGGLPGALITDYGTVSAASGGVKDLVPASNVVFASRTLYWLCAVVQTIGGVNLRAQASSSPLVLPSSTAVTAATINAYAQASVSGALPGTATPADATGGPRLMLHIASVP